jgi:LPXTG-site transpeptidase (sortase) family protein
MKSPLRSFNNLLTAVVVGFALYIIAAPVWPQIKWVFKDNTSAAPYSGVLATETPKSDLRPTPKDNRLVIPSALIDQPIYEGADISIIRDGGSWRKNLHVKSPLDPGNTVIVAHRFTYTQPEGGFYHLDKVSVNDKLAIYWQGEELIYKVVEKKIVSPETIEVEDNSVERRLTLYTCTPLVTAENRLVIIALPEELGS